MNIDCVFGIVDEEVVVVRVGMIDGEFVLVVFIDEVYREDSFENVFGGDLVFF